MIDAIAAGPGESSKRRARVIAFYLPQFHTIPENDAWWGPGFTEWTNVVRARPLFRGHVQPHLPADLGFYDLRVPEIRERQAYLARVHGLEGFCYWHYWFAGRRLLERPFEEVLRSGSPSLPFMLGWANGSWTGIWHGAPDRVLIEQTYPGRADHVRHFEYLLRAFRDPRYMRMDGKPIFHFYSPHAIPDLQDVAMLWREMARAAKLPGLYLTGQSHKPVPGLDALVSVNMPTEPRGPVARLRRWLRGGVAVQDYGQWLPRFVTARVSLGDAHPCVVPNWDNTPRSGRAGRVLSGTTPDLFRTQVKLACDLISHKPFEHRLIFVKSWNEWAEGNYLEPDQEYGSGYLEALASEVLARDGDGRRLSAAMGAAIHG